MDLLPAPTDPPILGRPIEDGVPRERPRVPTRALKLSILMPAYDEDRTVAQAVRAVLGQEYPCPIELVLVDDGSRIPVSGHLEDIEDPRLTVLRHEVNLGKGAALRQAAAVATGSHVVPFDADLEYDPADLVAMLAPVLAGRSEIVYGTRLLGPNTRFWSYRHAFANRFLTMAANLTFDAYITDLHTCLKLMPLDLFRSYSLREAGFGLDTEITARILRTGARPFEVPISYHGRSRAQGKKITWLDGIACLVILARVRRAPLRVILRDVQGGQAAERRAPDDVRFPRRRPVLVTSHAEQVAAAEVSSAPSKSRPVIALVTDAIGPWHRGGKEQRYLELARRLAERAEVHVYTMNWWQGAKIRRDGDVTYHAIAPWLPLYSGPRRSIRQAILFAVCCLRLLTERFDVIEADHMPYVQLFPLRLVAWLRRKRLVVTWHECWGPEYWRSYLGEPGRIGWLLERAAMRLPDMIIAASPQTADRLREFTRGRVPIIVAPNGIDLAIVDKIEATGEPADVVVVGRLLPHKRIDLLLEALAILKEEGRPVSAQIVGGGPQLADLTTQARALGLADLVDFRQDISDQRLLYGVLKASRVAVFPSEREGFGIAVLEALACGTPVITTSAPANYAQYLIDEAAGRGVVCDPTAPALADAIRDTLERTGVDARHDTTWLQRYSWATTADRVADALS